MRHLVVAAVLAGLAFTASALPSVDDVQAEVAKGNYAHAEEMMHDVVAAKPGSARAHYVYAEILAHDKRFERAAEELGRAKAIDPALRFTDPEKFRAFEQLLEREQAATRRALAVSPAAAPVGREPAAAEGGGGGVPGWVWGAGLAALAFMAWRMFAARRQAAVSPAYAPGAAGGLFPAGAPQGAPAGGYGPAVPGAAAGGSGLLGTGLAVAGGVAAGMLAEKLLESRHQNGSAPIFPAASTGLESNLFDDAGGDNAAARELEERPVDFGSGDGWDGGDAGGGDDGW